jgi:DNA phosphorothioation-associated putative methyltransferase
MNGMFVDPLKTTIIQHYCCMMTWVVRKRKGSRPLALAVSHRLISPSSKILEYGCGRGADIRLLQKAGIPASGWDPHFRPDDTLLPADCVNLGHVLNVIEDPAERAATLHNAFQLAEKVLIVAVRVDQTLGDAPEFADGVFTKVGSFQKLYTQQEFKDYLRAILGHQPHMASLYFQRFTS